MARERVRRYQFLTFDAGGAVPDGACRLNQALQSTATELVISKVDSRGISFEDGIAELEVAITIEDVPSIGLRWVMRTACPLRLPLSQAAGRFRATQTGCRYMEQHSPRIGWWWAMRTLCRPLPRRSPAGARCSRTPTAYRPTGLCSRKIVWGSGMRTGCGNHGKPCSHLGREWCSDAQPVTNTELALLSGATSLGGSVGKNLIDNGNHRIYQRTPASGGLRLEYCTQS